MALVWQHQVGNKLYQVRRAGDSIRLYTNGVFHSQFNSKYPLGGSIWDLLVIPALFSPENIVRILVLGLGGGAAVRTIQTLLPNRHITAVEIDPIHLHVAKTYFGVKPNKQTRLIKADAVSWLNDYSGEGFDFILDDLFVDTEGSPDRAVSSNRTWCDLLLKNLSAKGVLAINFDSSNVLQGSALLKHPRYSKLFASRFSLSVPAYDNRIAALFKTPQTRENLKRTMGELERSNGKNLTQRFNAHIRKL